MQMNEHCETSTMPFIMENTVSTKKMELDLPFQPSAEVLAIVRAKQAAMRRRMGRNSEVISTSPSIVSTMGETPMVNQEAHSMSYAVLQSSPSSNVVATLEEPPMVKQEQNSRSGAVLNTTTNQENRGEMYKEEIVNAIKIAQEVLKKSACISSTREIGKSF